MTSQHLSAITSFRGELITRTSKMRRGIFLGGVLAENPKIWIFPRDVAAVINGGDFSEEKHRRAHTWARPWTTFRGQFLNEHSLFFRVICVTFRFLFNGRFILSYDSIKVVFFYELNIIEKTVFVICFWL